MTTETPDPIDVRHNPESQAAESDRSSLVSRANDGGAPPRDAPESGELPEPGGVEVIPPEERHGRPVQLLWTWASPNFEFATVAVGILGVLAFGLTFWQATAALVLGTALGSLTLGILSTWGPRDGLAQMVL